MSVETGIPGTCNHRFCGKSSGILEISYSKEDLFTKLKQREITGLAQKPTA
jgi:hypothetical protein